jgi:hypothetical protein
LRLILVWFIAFLLEESIKHEVETIMLSEEILRSQIIDNPFLEQQHHNFA